MGPSVSSSRACLRIWQNPMHMPLRSRPEPVLSFQRAALIPRVANARVALAYRRPAMPFTTTYHFWQTISHG